MNTGLKNKLIADERMRLRDEFAKAAMQAIVSRGIVNEVPLEVYATNAYKMADAMLKAREQ